MEKVRINEELFLRDELINLLLIDEGLTETDGPNRSPLVDYINKEIGAPLGSPYCISGFLIRGVKQLCTKHKLINPVYMTASTQEFANYVVKYRPQYIHEVPARALKADLCILQLIDDVKKGHGYTLTENESAHGQKTFEYNTNAQGSRNGDGNHRRLRFATGSKTMRYRFAVDVVAWILDANPAFKLVQPLAPV